LGDDNFKLVSIIKQKNIENKTLQQEVIRFSMSNPPDLLAARLASAEFSLPSGGIGLLADKQELSGLEYAVLRVECSANLQLKGSLKHY